MKVFPLSKRVRWSLALVATALFGMVIYWLLFNLQNQKSELARMVAILSPWLYGCIMVTLLKKEINSIL